MYFADQDLLESRDFFEMQKWNISTYSAHRVDEKDDAICLVMFTSKVMVIWMSKMTYLMYFLLNTEKTQTQFVQDI